MRKFIIAISFIILAFPALAQHEGHNQDTIMKSGMMKQKMQGVMPKPVFEGTSAGKHLKVWIMSRMKGADETGMNKDMSDDGMKKGTHHIMVEITDAQSGEDVIDAVVKILAVTPSGKEFMVDLEKMMGQYGGNLTFDEKGDYQLNISIDSDGASNLTPFRYTVD